MRSCLGGGGEREGVGWLIIHLIRDMLNSGFYEFCYV
jgi:hypothetical protein